ncbi:PREDICTED: 14 kDa proline-rich protein DC2.15-like [Theobroma cacao]|uniref:14 kDa proline-rich protein DC2.15-like n=1 Tax=Theobroma cacao TaxID=3641 RepID=A0AB32X324_THECC|nr:PREDICTED: 14 kDa proline-rich protein DC2.15-like [Theobroma cacao]
MASKVSASTVLFLSFNLLFLAFCVSSHNVDYPSDNDGKINPHDSSNGGKSTCKPLNLGVCANLLNGLVKVELGDVPTKPCCSLIQGLADIEAAVCLCTAIKANVLGIKLDLPISLSVLLNNCGREVSSDYQCTP